MVEERPKAQRWGTRMKIVIRQHQVEINDQLREHVQRRIGLALGRFGDLVSRVTVRFSKDAEHTRCRINVGVRPEPVRTEDTNADIFAAVDHAADRASRSIDRALELERDGAAFPTKDPRTAE
jgi:putative sigma-54 modulation protein